MVKWSPRTARTEETEPKRLSSQGRNVPQLLAEHLKSLFPLASSKMLQICHDIVLKTCLKTNPINKELKFGRIRLGIMRSSSRAGMILRYWHIQETVTITLLWGFKRFWMWFVYGYAPHKFITFYARRQKLEKLKIFKRSKTRFVEWKRWRWGW